MDIEIKDSTIEDLAYYAKMIFDEMEARYDNLSALYEALHDDYNELAEEKESSKTYESGYEDGKYSMQKKAYKICEYWNNNDTDILSKLFDGWTWTQIFEDIEMAYNKIAEYEKKEKEIHVGDEVVDGDGEKCVVRALDGGYIYLLGHSGDAFMLGYSNVSKTGKHYPLEEMLKEL